MGTNLDVSHAAVDGALEWRTLVLEHDVGELGIQQLLWGGLLNEGESEAALKLELELWEG